MTVYRNYQRMTMQEAPRSVPPARLPRHREVIVLWDLIDGAKPGEEVVRVLPKYTMRVKTGLI
jgi:DNA replication licensing factor MCM2